MQIIAIKKEKQHLSRIVLDNGEEVLLDNDICSDNSLKIGVELTVLNLEQLISISNYARAKSRALWYLDRSDITEKALFEKLVRAGFEKRASAKVIKRLVEVELINDRRYAENYAEKLLNSNVSKREAVGKMLSKGVPYDLVKEVLDNFDTDEEEQIKNLIEKKYKNKLIAENGAQKVYAALIRKGFSYGAVRSVIKNYIEEQEFCEE